MTLLPGNRIVALLLSAMFYMSATAHGDGLIFQLPADGTWAEFSGDGTAFVELELPKQILAGMDERGKQWIADMSGEQAIRSTIRISSVGGENYSRRACRWIELSGASTVTNKKTAHIQSTDTQSIKMLIPELYLQRGHDPLDNAIFTFWNSKDADLAGIANEKGFDRIRYEIDRFLPLFAPSLRDEKRLPIETIKTPAGEFRDCEVVSGSSKFDRPTRNNGRWDGTCQWTIAIHPDAPFGVVRVAYESTGNEISGESHAKVKQVNVLTLTKTGNDARSTLPNLRKTSNSAAESK